MLPCRCLSVDLNGGGGVLLTHHMEKLAVPSVFRRCDGSFGCLWGFLWACGRARRQSLYQRLHHRLVLVLSDLGYVYTSFTKRGLSVQAHERAGGWSHQSHSKCGRATEGQLKA